MKPGPNFSKVLGLSLVFLLSTQALYSGETSPAEPRYTVSPKLPAKLGDEKGYVRVEAKINRFGQVTSVRSISSSNNDLVDSCLDAMVRWKFEPAKKGGKPIASTVVQPFEFNIGTVSLAKKKDPFTQAPHAYKRTAPKLEDRYLNINGNVSFRVSLNSEGGITNIALKESTHPELVEPTRQALEKWKFSPSIEQGKAVPSKVLVPFAFKASVQTRNKTVNNAYALNKVDVEPTIISKHEPILPVALEKEQGLAWLMLYIDEYGYVAQTDTLKSTSKEMSRLATAAVSQWKYKPAIKKGRNVPSKLAVPFRSQGGLLVSQLPADKRAKPIQKKSPKLPASLSDISGYVRVLLELDEKGNVVRASARESSHTQLDDLAIQAAEKWKFKPAQRDGEPVASSLILPFIFGKS